VQTPTLDEWNSDAYKQLRLISERLTWDLTTSLYEEQEAAMTNYSGNIVHNAAVRGHIGNLACKSGFSLTTDLADVTDDGNFYCVFRAAF
jgi:hypothetical protein